MKSRKLFSNDADGPSSDSLCGYENALLRWLTGGFSRSVRRQQSMATWPSDGTDGTESDTGLSLDEHDRVNRMVMTDIEHGTSVGHDSLIVNAAAVELMSTQEHNETWIMTELLASTPLGIVPTKRNVTYTATAEVISVLE